MSNLSYTKIWWQGIVFPALFPLEQSLPLLASLRAHEVRLRLYARLRLEPPTSQCPLSTRMSFESWQHLQLPPICPENATCYPAPSDHLLPPESRQIKHKCHHLSHCCPETQEVAYPDVVSEHHEASDSLTWLTGLVPFKIH